MGRPARAAATIRSSPSRPPAPSTSGNLSTVAGKARGCHGSLGVRLRAAVCPARAVDRGGADVDEGAHTASGRRAEQGGRPSHVDPFVRPRRPGVRARREVDDPVRAVDERAQRRLVEEIAPHCLVGAGNRCPVDQATHPEARRAERLDDAGSQRARTTGDRDERAALRSFSPHDRRS